MQLSIVLPAYNESTNLPHVIKQIDEVMKECACIHEIIVVNDGSTDDTQAVLTNLKNPAVVIKTHPENRGYGQALITGFNAASYEWVFFMDADRQFDFSDIKKMIEYIESGSNEKPDMVIGYRAERKDNILRHINSKIYNWSTRYLFGIKVKDLNCAFKLICKDLLAKMYLSETGALINAELMLEAKHLKAKVIEMPVQHFPRVSGSSTGGNLFVVLLAMCSFAALKIKVIFKRI